ncbi:MAG: aliphatic sulfonate ABC transporter substrate-binding protein [Lachnospiraceae bacterium]|nr:aliphatic sulfonate ABC transporter substrate-binding protein [Lachnospiraceae bacterium]
MKKSNRILLGLFILTSMLLWACAGKGDESEVTIGYFNNITHAQALIMKSENTLQNALGEDIKVKWTAFNAGPAEVEALFSGDIDIGYIGPVPAISAYIKSKGDVQILTGATKAGSILVKRKDVQINNVSDLADKVVGISQIGNTQHLILLQILSENNLKPKTEGGNVTVTAVANADMENAMGRGDIDAAIVPEPWGASLLEKGAEMVLNEKELYQNGEYDVALVVVRKEFKEKYPEIVEEFLKQHEAATLVLNDKKEYALKEINKELEKETGKKLSDTIMKDAFNRIGVSNKLNKDSIQRFGEISKEQKFINEFSSDNLYIEP